MKPRFRPIVVSSVAAAALLLTACSGGAAGGENSEETSGLNIDLAAVIEPATTDVDSITWNLATGEPTTLDPGLSALMSNSYVVANLCEALYYRDAEGLLAPALAESFEKTSDTTYVFTLREDATFWDGSPVTPDDVVFSIMRIFDPALGSSWGGWAPKGATATATGEHEVTVTLNAPNAVVENYFATPAFMVTQKKYAEEAGEAFGTATGGIMCSGPYQLEEWASGQYIDVTKNDSWWNTERGAFISDVQFTFNTDPTGQVAALQSGSVNGTFGVPVSAMSTLADEGHLYFSESYTTGYLAGLNQEGALSELAVRQALQAVIDYEGIVDAVYEGTAEPLRAIVPPGAWGYSQEIYQAAWDELPEAAQNLEKAQGLLDESNYDGAEITLAYMASDEANTTTATVIADSAQAIGLNVVLKPMQPADYVATFSGPEARAGIDLLFVIGYLDFPEPISYLQFSTTGHYYNFNGYSNPVFDDLILGALEEFDEDKRAEMAAEAQAIRSADLASIPLVSQYTSVYYGSDLTGLAPSPNNLYSPWLPYLGGK